jgi:hypothetical protein
VTSGVKISARKMADHAPSSVTLRLILWTGEIDGEESILDIVEFGDSVNENKTRRDVLQLVDEFLEYSDVTRVEIRYTRR